MKKLITLSLVALMGLSACTNVFDGVEDMKDNMPTNYDYLAVYVNTNANTLDAGVMTACLYNEAIQDNYYGDQINNDFTYVIDRAYAGNKRFNNIGAYAFEPSVSYVEKMGVEITGKTRTMSTIKVTGAVIDGSVDMAGDGIDAINCPVYEYEVTKKDEEVQVKEIPQIGGLNLVAVPFYVATVSFPTITFDLGGEVKDNPDGTGMTYICPKTWEERNTTGYIISDVNPHIDAIIGESYDVYAERFAQWHIMGTVFVAVVPVDKDGYINLTEWPNILGIDASRINIATGAAVTHHLDFRIKDISTTQNAVLANLQAPFKKLVDYFPATAWAKMNDVMTTIPEPLMDVLDAQIANLGTRVFGIKEKSALKAIQYFNPEMRGEATGTIK